MGRRYARTDDYPHGFAPEVAEQLLQTVESLWIPGGWRVFAVKDVRPGDRS